MNIPEYKVKRLIRKLETAENLLSKATLDEWEVVYVARLVTANSKAEPWKNSKIS